MLSVLLSGLLLSAPPEVGSPRYNVDTTQSEIIEPTPIQEYARNGMLNLSEAKQIPAGQFLGLQRVDLPRPAYPSLPGVLLANGDYLVGEVSSGDAKALTVQARFGTNDSTQRISIPLTAIIAVWCVGPPERELDRVRWNLDARRADQLLLRNKDTIRGTLISIDNKWIKFKTQGEMSAKTYELATVASTHLDPGLARVKLPANYHKLITRNGSRIALAELILQGRNIEGKTLFGAGVSIAVDDLVAWDRIQENARSLVELKPVELVETPFNALIWKMKHHRTVEDRPLLIKTSRGVETYDIGLGLHSATSVTYELPKDAIRLDTLVALDAATGQKGCVDIRILLDGKEQNLPQLKGMKFGPAVELRLPLGNARKLTLAVDFGSGGDIQDVVNWAMPRVIVK